MSWLSPIQVKVLPVSVHEHDYAEEIKVSLEKQGIRTEVDVRDEKLGYKIREAQLEKIPYLFVVGEKERNCSRVSVRQHGTGDMGLRSLTEMIQRIVEDIQSKR